jgi:hypothetical protein
MCEDDILFELLAFAACCRDAALGRFSAILSMLSEWHCLLIACFLGTVSYDKLTDESDRIKASTIAP